MCLLVVAFGVLPTTPLLVGANRDEFYDRPALPMTILRASGPRVLGGRDQRSGGTWLAINQHGVFAGLTNQPISGTRDSSRRTRGELPLALTRHDSAEKGVAEFVQTHRPSDYNGSWLLTGDRHSLFFIDFTGLSDPTPVALTPGLYVLENRPLGAPSAKVDRMTAALTSLTDVEAGITTLRRVLADHATESARGEPAPEVDAGAHPAVGRPKSSSNCVHLEGYGTRSSCTVRMDDVRGSVPQVWVADGPPCSAPFVDFSDLWTAEVPEPR